MKRDAHFLTYMELMNAPTPAQQASRTLRRWLILTALLTALGLAWVIADRAHAKAVYDAEWGRNITKENRND